MHCESVSVKYVKHVGSRRTLSKRWVIRHGVLGIVLRVDLRERTVRVQIALRILAAHNNIE